MGIVFALRKLRFCLEGRRFPVYMDHEARTYMLEQGKPSDMFERWLVGVLEFDFTISHTPGIRNVLLGVMSWMCAAPQRDIAGVTASVRVLSRDGLPWLPALSTGLPLES